MFIDSQLLSYIFYESFGYMDRIKFSNQIMKDGVSNKGVEVTPNPLISLGNDPEGFSYEEMVGRVWMNNDEIEDLV